MEVWHHLPRAQAVAAALSAGRSSQAIAGAGGGADAGGAAEREVFLGSASGLLLDVLRRPQVCANRKAVCLLKRWLSPIGCRTCCRYGPALTSSASALACDTR